MQTLMRPKPSAERLNIALSTLWKWARENPEFPKPIKLSPNVTVFRVADLDAFVAKRQEGA